MTGPGQQWILLLPHPVISCAQHMGPPSESPWSGQTAPSRVGVVGWQSPSCPVSPSQSLPHILCLEFLILGDVCESDNSLLKGRPSEAGRSQHGPLLIGLTKAYPCPAGPRADLCAAVSWKLSFLGKGSGRKPTMKTSSHMPAKLLPKISHPVCFSFSSFFLT